MEFCNAVGHWGAVSEVALQRHMRKPGSVDFPIHPCADLVTCVTLVFHDMACGVSHDDVLSVKLWLEGYGAVHKIENLQFNGIYGKHPCVWLPFYAQGWLCSVHRATRLHIRVRTAHTNVNAFVRAYFFPYNIPGALWDVWAYDLKDALLHAQRSIVSDAHRQLPVPTVWNNMRIDLYHMLCWAAFRELQDALDDTTRTGCSERIHCGVIHNIMPADKDIRVPVPRDTVICGFAVWGAVQPVCASFTIENATSSGQPMSYNWNSDVLADATLCSTSHKTLQHRPYTVYQTPMLFAVSQQPNPSAFLELQFEEQGSDVRDIFLFHVCNASRVQSFAKLPNME